MKSLSMQLACLCVLTWTPTNQGFLPAGHHDYYSSRSHSTTTAVSRSSTPLYYVSKGFNDIDIDDVLAQTEQALMLAQDNLSSSDSSSIERELSNISKMQKELGNDNHSKSMKKKKTNVKSQTIASPKASSQSIFGNWVQKATHKMKPANATADQKEVKKEESAKAKHQSTVIKENFHKKFQQASHSAGKVIQDGLESKELDDLKKKATKTIMDSISKHKNKKTNKLIDVSDRDIDITDVLAEAEAALLAAESMELTLPAKKDEEKKPKAKTSFFSSMVTSKESTKVDKKKNKLIDISDRDIDITDVLAEAEAALLAAESKESALPAKKDEEKKPKAKTSFFSSIVTSKESTKVDKKKNKLIDISDRDIDITDVLAEAEAALLAAESKESALPAKKDEEKRPKAKTSFFSSKVTSKESTKVDTTNGNVNDVVGEAMASMSETIPEKTPPIKKEPKQQSGKNFKGPPEMIDISDRETDISNVMAEAEAALMRAESANAALSTSVPEAATEAVLPPHSTKDGSMLSQKWSDSIIAALNQWNEGAAPIRKSNRAILLYNMVQFMIVHRDLVAAAVTQSAMFMQSQNHRLSPIRKKNRSNVAHTTVQFAVLHKILVIEAAQAAMKFAQNQNQKIRPIRKANRDALVRTFVQSILLHKILAIGARHGIASWVRAQNAWMAPIRVKNRQNLTHSLSRFLLLQRHLFRYAKANLAVWWSLESKRMAANRGINRDIISHDLVEAMKVQKNFHQGLRAAPSNLSAILSRVLAILLEQIKEDAQPSTPESVLESTF
ncbi:unnamed protein product [Cylindrotheca closterium]|uniref:Uncharacterized protein n=1 Tax=Cylindrotheca closterium TaxID=2856 RepID=A0AAD2CS11_9STRA|nr:unnamed protein product [Cylindrotheca closterium]